MNRTIAVLLMVASAATFVGGCAATASAEKTTRTALSAEQKFERDREAILAMAGNFRVQFDFIETVAFADDYELKDRKLSGGDEIVRIIEDRGDYISLQHILVVGGDEKFPVKHWRQDWYYEPESVLVYVGGNAWEKRAVGAAEAKGKWSQIVYQVDDSPRYGALASWTHTNGVSQWTAPREWRPLPRRDATTRDDYHTVNAVNRHAITPAGWVHEQDNSKLVLTGEPQTLVREIAINTYDRFDDFDIDIGEDYWARTEGFWSKIREEWLKIEAENESFGLAVQGESEALYMPIFELAGAVNDGEKDVEDALVEARAVIATCMTTEIGSLAARLSDPESSC
ncbi:MAG: DUF6607 family protein [Pseudomonadota bacterium]